MSAPGNPFLETDPKLTEDQRIRITVYNAVNVLAILESLFADPPDGRTTIQFGLEEYTGVQRIIAGAKGALNHAADRIDCLESSHHQELKDLHAQEERLGKLDSSQREIVLQLADDIAARAVNPVLIESRDAARVVLARLEAVSETLDLDQCGRELERYDYEVAVRQDGGFSLSHEWSLKGLQHSLARERFLEAVMCDVQSEWPTPTAGEVSQASIGS